MRTNSLFLALILTSLLASSAAPCEFPICTAAGVQLYPLIASDWVGGALIAWQDFRNGADYDIYAQRVQTSPSGLMVVPGWPADGVALTQHPADQGPSAIVPDGAGGALVVWGDRRDAVTGGNLYCQHVTAVGTIADGWPLDGVPLCTAPGDQGFLSAISDGAGGALVVSEDYREGPPPGNPGASPDVYATRILADGSLAQGWAPDGNPVCTAPGAQGTAVLTADGSGGAIVAWVDGRNFTGFGGNVYAGRITAEGAIAPGWPADGVVLTAVQGRQGGYVRIVTDGIGGAIVAWEDYRNDPSEYPYPDLYAQRVLGDGMIAPGWPADGLAVAVAPDYQWNADMVSDGAGGAILVWEDYRNYLPWASDLFGQRITGSGTVAPGWPENGIVVATGQGWQLRPSVVSDGRGGILVAFESTPNSYDLYAQRVLGDGTIAPGWPAEGRALCTGTATDVEPAAVSDGRDGMIVASEHGTAAGHDIYANWVPGDGPTPTLVVLVGVEAEPDRVVLAWYGAEAAGLAATVERQRESSEWRPLGSVIADGTGTFRFEDRDVRPGERYGYRLAYRSEGSEVTTAGEWVTVPVPRFVLAGAQPNPVVDEVVVGFSLPDGRPAWLEVFDLAGRQVVAREVGSLGVGSHRVTLAEGRALPAGVYHLALTQGAQRSVARMVVTR